MSNSTKRFSDKVQNYARYRPGYPPEILNYLKSEGGLQSKDSIVDVGSGTGIFTRLLLDAGYTVYAVEPNEQMRHVAEISLSNYPEFISVAATGEQTTLPSNSADMIVSATAFHWLDATKAKTEFTRVLKPSGKVSLIWNIRRTDADPFSVEYERFWQASERANKHDVTESELKSFFLDGRFATKSFHHSQVFDLEGLIGRSFSSSFSPKEGTTEAVEFRMKLRALFDRYQNNGVIQIHYTAKVYIGSVD